MSHVAAVGDLNVTQKLVNSAGVDQEYGIVFLDGAHLLADADIFVSSVRGVLVGDTYGKRRSTPCPMMLAL